MIEIIIMLESMIIIIDAENSNNTNCFEPGQLPVGSGPVWLIDIESSAIKHNNFAC